MEFTHSVENEVLIITLQGENLDVMTYPSIKDQMLNLISQLKMKKIVIDLGQIKFIDSSGLGTLLTLQKAANRMGGKLKLANPTKQVQTMFETVSMNRVLDLSPTIEDALKSF